MNLRPLNASPILLLALSVTACGSEGPMPPGEGNASSEYAAMSSDGDSPAEHSRDVNQLLAELRRATVQFQDPDAATAAGYHSEQVCISAPDVGAPEELGAMGIHYINPALIDDTFEPLKPEVLVYDPRGNGNLQLVAVEYLVVGDEPPPFAGEIHFHPFPLPQADHALHAWVWRGNPNGTFADLNPNVTCPPS